MGLFCGKNKASDLYNSALKKVNMPFSNKAKTTVSNSKYTKILKKLKLNDGGNWPEEHNVRNIFIKFLKVYVILVIFYF